MLTVFITKGLPGSGKTHWAKEKLAENPNGIKRVSKDDLRAMLDGGKWSGDAEKFILKARDILIIAALDNGKHVIVDDTNLHERHEVRIRQVVGNAARVEVVDFTNVDVDTCVERDLKRANPVGEAVIWRMYRQFLAKPTEKPSDVPGLLNIIICDIDGTLALHNGRSPYEFEKAGDDLLNKPVHSILESARHTEQGETILVTGREEKYRLQTEEWLVENNVFYYALFMRPTGDTRRDDIVKKEIYEREIRGKFNVSYVIDDRNRTVAFWRSLGLTCFQVNYGDF